MQQNADTTPDNTQRFTVAKAADLLGITAEAVRQRIRRGTLPSEKDKSGNVFVFLDARKYQAPRQPHDDATQHDGDYTNDATFDYTELVDALRDQVSSLKEEVEAWREETRRKDHLLAAALERIPAIEPPSDTTSSEPRESPQTATEESSKDDVPPEQERRSWWRRLFGP
jgi:hypothetical protein